MKNLANHLVMDIYSPPGTKVLFQFPNNGYRNEHLRARSLMCVGNRYTVRAIEVGDCSSLVLLEEVPYVWFNTVFFANEP